MKFSSRFLSRIFKKKIESVPEVRITNSFDHSSWTASIRSWITTKTRRTIRQTAKGTKSTPSSFATTCFPAVFAFFNYNIAIRFLSGLTNSPSTVRWDHGQTNSVVNPDLELGSSAASHINWSLVQLKFSFCESILSVCNAYRNSSCGKIEELH